jgi:hypothetical protein
MEGGRMSLLLFLFYWVVIPVSVIAVAAWLWRRSYSPAARGLIGVVCVATLSGLLWLAVGEKWLADRQVRELCAKDGGVRVYGTVVLPPEKFNQWGQPNFQIPITPYTKLKDTDEYYLEWETASLRRGNPEIERSHFRLVRRSDNQLLGESVTYSRNGGDLPGPWQGSSLICPEPTKHQSLESSVFIKGVKQ